MIQTVAWCAWGAEPASDGRGQAPSGSKIAQALAPVTRENTSLCVRSMDGRVLFEHNAEIPRTPASVLKLLSVGAALATLGADYHFHTDVYVHDGVITLKGFGDPSMVSEEWERLIETLPAGLHFTEVVVDDSYFASQLGIVQEPDVYNPYNALNGAFASNFNTLAFTLQPDDSIVSEAQTPWVDFVQVDVERTASSLVHLKIALNEPQLRLSIRAPRGQRRSMRMHLGFEPEASSLYAGHLFVAFGRAKGRPWEAVTVRRGLAPPDASPTHVYHNTQSLRDVVIALLKYSNNFMANQVLLAAGAASRGAPADLAKALAVLRQHAQKYGVTSLLAKEASGLDPDNRITMADLSGYLGRVTTDFPTYFEMLPEVDTAPGVYAKTGTFDDNGVRALAGFVTAQGKPQATFAFVCNGPQCSYRTAQQLQRAAADLARAGGGPSDQAR